MIHSGPMPGWCKTLASGLFFNSLVAAGLTIAWVIGSGRASAALEAFAANFVVSNCIGFPCMTIVPAAIPGIWPRPVWMRWGMLVALLLAIALGGCLAASAILYAAGMCRGSILEQTWTIYRHAALVTLGIGVLGTSFEMLRARLERTELERERAGKLAAEAQLASIESRIQPHFLFNALNSVSSLIREDPDRAERLIERLSALLRTSLDTQHASLVPLEGEIQLVRDYLEIQSARFGSRLRFSIDVEPGLADAAVPPFSIQTLVENSIKHGIARRREGGEVRVTVRGVEGALRIEVRDDGPGFGAAEKKPGRGLDNLESRLLALFGSGAPVTVERAGPGVTVSFLIPRKADASLSPG